MARFPTVRPHQSVVIPAGKAPASSKQRLIRLGDVAFRFHVRDRLEQLFAVGGRTQEIRGLVGLRNRDFNFLVRERRFQALQKLASSSSALRR